MERTNTKHFHGERAFWVKGVESQLAKERGLTVILREKDRSDPQRNPLQWLPLLEPVPVYHIILGTGNPAKGILPDFERDEGLTVQVVRRTVTRLDDIKDADLEFGSGRAVPKHASDIKQYLEEEYAPGRSFSPDSLFTVYWVEYVADEPPATDELDNP